MTTNIGNSSSSSSKTKNNIFLESICQNPACSAPTLISLVPTGNVPQLIKNPKVVPDPVLINGYTSVFQIDGTEAEIITKKTENNLDSPIYRVVPNTHAHIINYVLIDDKEEILLKIKNNDPVATKNLLNSQINSAKTLLNKLIEDNRKPKENVQNSVNPISLNQTQGTNILSRPTFPRAILPKPTLSKTTVQPELQSSFLLKSSPILKSCSTIVTSAPAPLPTTNLSITKVHYANPAKLPTLTPYTKIVQKPSTVKCTTKPTTIQIKTISPNISNVAPAVAGNAKILKPERAPLPLMLDSVRTPVVNQVGININLFEKMQAELKELKETVQKLKENSN